jgi:toxin ParE1/3/4
MAYRTTPQADQDIIDIYLWGCREFGQSQAELYHAGLAAALDLIAENLRIARQRHQFTPAARLHPYHSHMIVYLLDEVGVVVVRVLHGRQVGKAESDFMPSGASKTDAEGGSPCPLRWRHRAQRASILVSLVFSRHKFVDSDVSRALPQCFYVCDRSVDLGLRQVGFRPDPGYRAPCRVMTIVSLRSTSSRSWGR